MNQTPWEMTIVNLTAIEEALRDAKREGKRRDNPEGSRFIMISDTLAKHWATSIKVAKQIILEDRGGGLDDAYILGAKTLEEHRG